MGRGMEGRSVSRISASRKSGVRCGHYEQVKDHGQWKCVACGQILTIPESIQNSIELSDVMKSAMATGRPLNESLDDMLGRKEWDEILTKLRTKKKTSEREKM
jgi:hypothetical protein